jgi:hypothetical protein
LSPFVREDRYVVLYSDSEACDFYTNLHRAIWNVTLGLGTRWASAQATDEAARAVVGVRVEVSKDATKEEKAAAKALWKWLRAEGFSDEGLRTVMRERVMWRFAGALKSIKVTVGIRG